MGKIETPYYKTLAGIFAADVFIKQPLYTGEIAS